MWKDYSKGYIKNNRAAGLSVIAAAFAATVFLSFLCTVAYNTWTYEVERIVIGEGDWQARITGELQESEIAFIENYASVEKVVANLEDQSKQQTYTDVYFTNMRTVYRDMPLIAKQLGRSEDAVNYHELYLSRYLIHDPSDQTPPLLISFFIFVVFIMSLSLALIIRNSFELSMNARIHQFGILSSIGATPRQIRACLLQEAAVLSAIPILIGTAVGTAFGYFVLCFVNVFAGDVGGRHQAVFQYHIAVLLITLLVSAFTVFLSAWAPARKLSKLTPLEAIRNAAGIQLKRRKRAGILSWIFGVEGELAQNALKARKKSFRISTISLLLSFLGFSLMLCFTTLSGISTRYTYFERYRDAWDVMLTVPNIDILDFDLTQQLRDTDGAGEVTVYQITEGKFFLPEEEQSEELLALGGLTQVAQSVQEDGGYWVPTQIVIMDNESFDAFGTRVRGSAEGEGAVLYNQIWDSIHTNFRNSEYVPFIKENKQFLTVFGNEKAADIPIDTYTAEVPVLREEYDNYKPVLFISVSEWEKLQMPRDMVKSDLSVRVFSEETPTLESLNALETSLRTVMDRTYQTGSENRIQEQVSNDDMMRGMQLIFGGFCALLALIGVANVFSNTLGFIRQRKREFAQYLSVGMTPAKMRKVFCIEAMVIAGKPLLITMVLSVISVWFMTTASYLDPMVFWREAPILPVSIFAIAIIGFVALAYYIGGKKILSCDLSETLRNDAL